MVKVTLPAVEVEIPRMGMIVYVSPKIGMQQKKHTAMFTAEVAVKGKIELQSFHLKCDSEKHAIKTSLKMRKDLEKFGQVPFIQNKI